MISPLRPSRWGWRSAYVALNRVETVLSIRRALFEALSGFFYVTVPSWTS